MIEPDLGQLAFARHRGWSLNQVNIERRLALHVPRLENPRVGAPYRIETVVGPVQANWRQGYAAVLNRMNLDAPQGDQQLEVGERTAEMIAEQDAETNGHMVAINEAMGFRVTSRHGEFAKRVGGFLLVE